MSIRRPSTDRLHKLASANHFSISSDEEGSYTTLFNHILEQYDALEASTVAQRVPPLHRYYG